jgi:hypothetical protein
MSMGWCRATFVMVGVVLSGLATGCGVDPVDVIVYSERVPSFFRLSPNPSPQPFTNPFTDEKFFNHPEHPATRIIVKAVPGMQLPDGGNFAWGHVSWGKYVISGYHGGDGVTDQRVGVFDTETHAFCALDLDPSLHATNSVGWLAVADPQARTTRIYFQGLGLVGYQFGYIEADLDTAHPCDPVSGWSVVGFTGPDLNCRAVGLGFGCSWDDVCNALGAPAGCRPEGGDESFCPGPVQIPKDVVPCPDIGLFSVCGLPQFASCGWDGMDALDAETVVLHNWLSGLLVVLRVDAAGVLTMPDAYATRPYPPGQNCALLPVNHPVIDRNRPPGNQRWTSVFDVGGNCTYVGGKPAQEYRFDGTTITPTSPLFVPSQTAGFAGGSGPYDSAGNLWLDNRGSLYRSIATANGYEHAYYDESQPEAAVVVPPDQVMGFQGGDIFQSPNAVEVGNAVYWYTGALHAGAMIERAVAPSGPGGAWSIDASYKVTLGSTKLPAERGTCSVSQAFCGKTSDCGAAGGVCQFVCQTCGPIFCSASGSVCDDQGTACPTGQRCIDPGAPSIKHNMSRGGSPASLWAILDHDGASATRIARVPLSLPLPDAAVTSRPAIAWNGGDCAAHPRQCRLWLAAEKGGRLKYRVRDDGFWSGWFDVTPGAPPTVTGGAAILAHGTTVTVLARHATTGVVHWSILTSPATCEPGVDCTWQGWFPLPSGVTTQHDVAATIHGTAFIAVRNAADGKIWYTKALTGGIGWEPWAVIDGIATDAAPSVVSDLGRVAVAVREAGSGAIKVAFVLDSGGPTAWSEPGSASALKPWGTPPAIVRRTGQLQLYAAQSGAPQHVYVAASPGGEWGSWRRLPSRSTATEQPAAADVHGDTNLVTADAAGLAEEAAQ